MIILGGIYGGVMTPTEAACVSTLYCIPVAIYIYRGMKWSDAPEILKETGTTTGVIMVMLFFVSMLSRYFIYEDLPGALVDLSLYHQQKCHSADDECVHDYHGYADG